MAKDLASRSGVARSSEKPGRTMTYRPPRFRVDDRDALVPLMRAHTLATLVTSGEGGLQLTHLPLHVEVVGTTLWLRGHIARANPQWRTPPNEAVAIYRVADHYMSPTWYASKRADPRTVPTFDYVAIEARGPVEFIHEPARIEAIVRTLTTEHEAQVGGTWAVDDAPRAYIDIELQAIVGVEMRVETLLGTFKLHQNHPPENIESVVGALNDLGTDAARAIAAFVRASTHPA